MEGGNFFALSNFFGFFMLCGLILFRPCPRRCDLRVEKEARTLDNRIPGPSLPLRIRYGF